MNGNFLYKWTFRIWTGSQLPLTENNPYVKEAYLRVA